MTEREKIVLSVSHFLAPLAASMTQDGLEDFSYAMGRGIRLFATAHPGAAAFAAFMDGWNFEDTEVVTPSSM